jgi:hypothetical protein
VDCCFLVQLPAEPRDFDGGPITINGSKESECGSGRILTIIPPLSLLAATIFYSEPLTALDVHDFLSDEILREPYVVSIIAS